MAQNPSIPAVGKVRQCPRISIPGQAVWSSGQSEGWCDLLSLSSGGVGISPLLTIQPIEGMRFSLTFTINRRLDVPALLSIGPTELQFEDIQAEAVDVGAEQLSLRFVNPTETLQSRIANLIDSINTVCH
jgi:hypothetical protein